MQDGAEGSSSGFCGFWEPTLGSALACFVLIVTLTFRSLSDTPSSTLNCSQSSNTIYSGVPKGSLSVSLVSLTLACLLLLQEA